MDWGLQDVSKGGGVVWCGLGGSISPSFALVQLNSVNFAAEAQTFR